MQAIPQFHNGILYRSRTEARWGEFWSRAGVPVEYEPEGFDLDGEWYVPDFHVGGTTYFEVKGTSPTDRERRVARKLAEASQSPVVIAEGNPGVGRLVVYGVVKNPTSCVIVEEFRGDGAWLAEFTDGGGWAQPLAPGLTNCAASGAEHPLLSEAGRLQFRPPIADSEFAAVGDLVENLVRSLVGSRRPPA